MRVLIAYGSQRGGTAGLAYMIKNALTTRGVHADVKSCEHVHDLDGYDAVIVGGAVYMGHWHRAAKHFVRRFDHALRERSVWLFSSGPLDPTASRETIPPVPAVAELAHRIDAIEHVTFGGRLSGEAPGFMARAMAKSRSGDWRDPQDVERFADRVVYRLARAETRAHV